MFPSLESTFRSRVEFHRHSVDKLLAGEPVLLAKPLLNNDLRCSLRSKLNELRKWYFNSTDLNGVKLHEVDNLASAIKYLKLDDNLKIEAVLSGDSDITADDLVCVPKALVANIHDTVMKLTSDKTSTSTISDEWLNEYKQRQCCMYAGNDLDRMLDRLS